MKTKLLSLFVALTCTSSLFASFTQVDGIWYDFYSSTKTASVTYRGSYSSSYDNEYSGSVVIPETVTYNSTIYSVTTIEYGAFWDCSGLTSVTIPNSVTTIGNNAFYYCSGLTSVTIGNSVTTIGEKAFFNCSSLITINIPNSVTSISYDSFSGCESLPIIDNIRYADTYLIQVEDRTLTSYTIKEGTRWIKDHAFESCGKMDSITIPRTIIEVGREAFEGCGSLTKTYFTGTIAEWCNIQFGGFSSCPTYYSHNLYINDEEVTEITIPEGVEFIGCFAGCSNLKSVTIPNSVTTIKSYAFYYCSGLKSINLPNSITKIGSYAFYGCSNLTSINLPNSITEIGSYAFSRCFSLTSIDIPNSITEIKESTFERCSRLESITIPNSVTSVSNSAFDACTSLPVIGSIKYADTYLLNAVDRTLSTYTIKEGTRWIGFEAFRDCSNMTSITIPKSIESISSDVFKRCTSLPVIDGIRYADTYLIEAVDKTLSTYSIKDGTRWIGLSAFNRCTNLTSITIPYSVISLGGEAFYDCFNLTTITIPNWISVGYNCFGHSSYTSIKGKTIYVILSPFEYSSNPENLISENIKRLGSKYDDLTYIPQYAEVATWTATPTTIEMDIDLTYIPTTSLYDSISIDYFGEEKDIEKILTPSTKNHVIFTGLTPNQKANIYYTSKKIGENDWEEGAKLEIQLPKLTFTTQTPKIVSAGTAVVAAETNISDYETNVGFEWRKYDAPSTMPSKSGTAILCNGVMEGRLLNLGTDAYWNVRPYYEDLDGTRYYGEWITFDPSDFSYFEPTVHTYALATSPTSNAVQVRGYVMTGTDDVTEQGFEYWFNSGKKAPNRASAATADSVYRVTASGQVMTAVLEDLVYSTTYTCRAYAIAGGKTYYGEEVQFLTPEDPRPIYTLTVLAGENGNVNAVVSGQYREGEKITLKATPNEGYLFDQWSDGSTENPYIFTIMQDTEITASFKKNAGTELRNILPTTTATKYLHNGTLIINRNGKHYSAMGERIR